MKSFSDWFDENIDSLEDEYEEYKTELLEEDLYTPMDFIDFCEGRYLSILDDIAEMKYEQMKDER